MFISEIPDVTFAVFCLLVLSSADCKHHCHHRITAHSDKIISFTDQNFNTGGKEQEYCVLEIKSRPHHLINVNLNYRPRLATAVVNCSTDYLRVGNDNSRIDHELMTSYKFCEELTQENIISRDNYLWIVLRTSNKSATFKIEARSQPKVRCKTDEFECSPIQCVSMDVLCDGIADCHNNRDEFCQKNFANNSCFHCFDGTCIRPVLPRYSEDWGKEMWYLCDEIQHCPDGTDERKDICYRVNSRVTAMLSCVPNGVPSNNSTSVLMWNTVICDGKIDCLDGSDESIEMCQQSQGGASFKTNYISYGIVACSIVLVIVGSFLALRIHLKQVKEQRNIVIRRNENADSIYSMRIDTMESEDLKTRPVSTIEEEPEYIIAELSQSFPGSSTCQSCSDLHVMPLNGTSTRADNKDSLHFVDDNGIKHTEL